MKTRNYLSIFAIGAAVTMVLGGCTKEIENYENVEKPGTGNDAPVVAVVSAGIESADTKTYMGALEEVDGKKSRKVYWEDGDQISINGTPSVALSGVGDEAPSVEFGFTENLTTPYKAVYPVDMWKSATLVTLPTKYNLPKHTLKESFAQNALPMAAYSETGELLTFHHLCAVLKLSLTGDKTIDYVEFSGNNGEKVSGDMYLDCTETTAELRYSGVGDAEKLLKVEVDQTLSSTSTEIFIAVPVTYKTGEEATKGVYSDGFTVKVYDTDGDYMELVKTAACTFVAGHIYNMPSVKYDPAPTEITISNAEELIAFATDYNAGVYEGKKLAVKLTADIDMTGVTEYPSISGFDDTFNGDGHSITNYTVAKPIFDTIIDEGEVRNITIDSSCSFAVKGGTDFAPLARINNNNVVNCHCNADITVTGSTTVVTRIGGLVERFNSETSIIDGCTYTGTITFDSNFKATNDVYVGGLVARSAHAGSAIKNSTFNGYISYTGSCTTKLYMSGVIALNYGKVEECIVTADSEKDRLYFNTKQTAKVELYMGGIAANTATSSVMSGNHNNGGLYAYLSSQSGAGAVCYIGGLVGVNNNDIVESNNTGRVYFGGKHVKGEVGGIVGRNRAGSTINNCTNQGTLLTYARIRKTSLGGVCGYNLSSDVDNLTNEGKLLIDYALYNHKDETFMLGGVIGYNNVDITTSPKMTNKGEIDTSKHASDACAIYVGGVIGFTDKDVNTTNVSNTGVLPTSSGKLYVKELIGNK